MNRSSPPGFPGLPQPAARSRQHLDIRDAGLELFGPQWAGPLAALLGVSVRAVQRWANRQNDPPGGIAARIAELLAIARRSRADAAADRERQARERGTG